MTDTSLTETPREPPVEKPKRNWRGWLKEYAVIVIGVLTALAAQQAAEWWHWSGQYKQARENLASELAINANRGAYRVALFNCIDSRLDRAAAILDEATRTGTLPAVASIGPPQPRGWPRGAWESVIGAQVAANFPREQLVQIGLIYEQIREAAANSSQETEVWADLNTMVGPGRRFDPALDAALHSALSRARMYNSHLSMTGGQLLQRVFALDLPFSETDRKAVAENIARGRACRNLDSDRIPTHYGSTIFPAVRPTIENWKKYRPFTEKTVP